MFGYNISIWLKTWKIKIKLKIKIFICDFDVYKIIIFNRQQLIRIWPVAVSNYINLCISLVCSSFNSQYMLIIQQKLLMFKILWLPLGWIFKILKISQLIFVDDHMLRHNFRITDFCELNIWKKEACWTLRVGTN